MSKRKQWYSFSGHVDARQVSSSVTGWEVVQINARGDFVRVVQQFATFAEAEMYIQGLSSFIQQFREIRAVGAEEVIRTGQVLCPLQPLPLFDEPGTILTTRGFWDVTLDVLEGTTRVRTVANFAFGLLVMPILPAYKINSTNEEGVRSYSVNQGGLFPNILLDDAGWFVYESFARITQTATPVSFDPPFHSKAKRKVPAGSAIMCVLGYDIGQITENANVANLTFGIRFRMLVEN